MHPPHCRNQHQSIRHVRRPLLTPVMDGKRPSHTGRNHHFLGPFHPLCPARAFMAGATEKALDFLKQYSATRLLGDHVPYAVEAWPEGNQRHLSAESGLYGRIITEGIFGIRPTGLRTFDLTPRLPQEWNEMALRHIRAFEGDFDIEVTRAGAEREGDFIRIVVKDREGIILDRTVRNGSTVSCRTAR